MPRPFHALVPLLRAAAALALLAGLGRAQSAWTQPEGGQFVQLSLASIGPYDSLFRASGPSFDTGREISETSLELYGEYGLSDAWTLIGRVPLRYVDSGAVNGDATIQPVTIPSDSLTGLGNVLLGVRRRLGGGDLAVAGELQLELPAASADATSGLATGYAATTLRPLLSFGRGFGGGWVQGYVGASLRTDDYSNDWRVGAEVGWQATSRLALAATLDVVQSFEDGDVAIDPAQAQTGLFVNDQEYVSPGVKGLFRVSEHLGVSAALRGALDGNNVPEAPYLSVGVFLQR